MNFETIIKTTYLDIPVEDYFDGVCSKCGSELLKIRSNYK